MERVPSCRECIVTRLTERKTRLNLITNQTARYRGQDRAVVVEVSPDIATLRLLGTRTCYEVSWRGVFDYAAAIYADRQRSRKKAERGAKYDYLRAGCKP